VVLVGREVLIWRVTAWSMEAETDAKRAHAIRLLCILCPRRSRALRDRLAERAEERPTDAAPPTTKFPKPRKPRTETVATTDAEPKALEPKPASTD
jgi:hypothetical protein